MTALIVALCCLLVPAAGAGQDATGELEEILGGFEEEESAVPEPEATEAPRPKEARFWDLGGSVSVASSINYLRHRSTSGTNYTGLQKLRGRANLQLDLDLPGRWKARVAGYGFYDFAYRIRGRGAYTDDVLDLYEWDADFQEVYVQGSALPSLDLKIGRQVVNWGRSETLRVLDVLNPLDNREPGLADIEDLRWPVAMVRADYYLGPWSLTGIAIPEIRFDDEPPFGSDFFPAPARLPPERVPGNRAENAQWAAALSGIFHGWDVSFHFARYWDNTPHLVPALPSPQNPAGAVQEHSRLLLLGSGGNYTVGSWLFKGEVAYIDGTDYTLGATVIDPDLGPVAVPQETTEKSRIDAMGGVEYYGVADTSVALEVVNRHINGFEDRMRPFDVQRDNLETALRITADFFNTRLHVIALGVGFGEKLQDGAVLRLSADYELRDALNTGGGVLIFAGGDPLEVSELGRNDRVFFDVKYSF